VRLLAVILFIMIMDIYLSSNVRFVCSCLSCHIDVMVSETLVCIDVLYSLQHVDAGICPNTPLMTKALYL
jgi:hypothetical protein